MVAAVKLRQNGVASTFPSRIIARRQLSSAQPTGIDGLAGSMETVTVVRVVRTATVVVDVTVVVVKFESSVV